MDNNDELDVKIPTFDDLYNAEIDIQTAAILSLLEEKFSLRENKLSHDPFQFDNVIDIYKSGQLHQGTIEKITFNLELLGYNNVVVNNRKNLSNEDVFEITIKLDL